MIDQVLTRNEKRALRGKTLRRMKLDRVDLTYADLRGARIEGVWLHGADLSHADLRGAELVRCDLRMACFEAATWGENRFEGSWLSGASGIAKATRAQLIVQGANFEWPLGIGRPCDPDGD